MSEQREKLICEVGEILSNINRPNDDILLSGDGGFYHKNGNLIGRYELLCDHYKMKNAIYRASCLLEVILRTE